MLFRIAFFIVLTLAVSVAPLMAQEQEPAADTEAAAVETDAEAELDAEEVEIQAQKVAAAQRYLQNIDLDHSFENIYVALLERLPGEAGAAVIATMRENVRMDRVKDMVVETLLNHYTLEELEALADFYSSDVGRSISRKLPAYLEDVNMAIQQEAERAFSVAVEDVQKKAMEKMAAEQKARQEAQKQQNDAQQPAPETDDAKSAPEGEQQEAAGQQEAAEEAPATEKKQKWQRKGGSQE